MNTHADTLRAMAAKDRLFLTESTRQGADECAAKIQAEIDACEAGAVALDQEQPTSASSERARRREQDEQNDDQSRSGHPSVISDGDPRGDDRD